MEENMGRQWHFAMDESDEKLFTQYLKENGYVVYWNDHDVMPKTTNCIPEPNLEKWSQVFIYHSAFGDMKFTRYDYDEKLKIEKYFVYPYVAPVIEFDRTVVFPEKKRICAGRIWMQMKYWNENDEYVSKSENLEKGYKDIKKWITKNLPKMDDHDAKGKVEKSAVSKELIRLFREEGYHW